MPPRGRSGDAESPVCLLFFLFFRDEQIETEQEEANPVQTPANCSVARGHHGKFLENTRLSGHVAREAAWLAKVDNLTTGCRAAVGALTAEGRITAGWMSVVGLTRDGRLSAGLSLVEPTGFRRRIRRSPDGLPGRRRAVRYVWLPGRRVRL